MSQKTHPKCTTICPEWHYTHVDKDIEGEGDRILKGDRNTTWEEIIEWLLPSKVNKKLEICDFKLCSHEEMNDMYGFPLWNFMQLNQHYCDRKQKW